MPRTKRVATPTEPSKAQTRMRLLGILKGRSVNTFALQMVEDCLRAVLPPTIAGWRARHVIGLLLLPELMHEAPRMWESLVDRCYRAAAQAEPARARRNDLGAALASASAMSPSPATIRLFLDPELAARITDEECRAALSAWRRGRGQPRTTKTDPKWTALARLCDRLAIGPVSPTTLESEWALFRKLGGELCPQGR
jgi:hypothetical protein